MSEPWSNTKTAKEPIRIGISACLLGEKVRFDGGHKRDRYLTDTLGQYFRWVAVCPEVEVGLPTPRPSLRLELHDGQLRMVMPKEHRDLTQPMRTYAKSRAKALESEGLSGYLLKKDSPSCGLERVRVYKGPGQPPNRNGRGLFAEALLARFPNLPVEEEGRLHDPPLRENWVTRVFAYHRLCRLWSQHWKVGDLVRFHTAHKFLLLAHSPKEFQGLGPLVAKAKSFGRKELRETYESQFMSALSKAATRAKNTNVLQHVLGFFKKDLDSTSRQELLGHIQDYRRGLVPLIVPLTLVAHYVRMLDVAYLRDQVYLNPHPKELALRNHV
ncbi:MAG: YbgA family protein [Planctomycetota bacterium]|jgi:uncharacterized protein YbgA (DUF1722 family)/uncharacterized protein YbbK (DUF523 family)